MVVMRQLSTESNHKCSTMVSTEQPSVIISQSSSRIHSVGHPLPVSSSSSSHQHLNISQPHIAFGGSSNMPELEIGQPLATYQQHTSDGESSPLQYSTLHPIQSSSYGIIHPPVDSNNWPTSTYNLSLDLSHKGDLTGCGSPAAADPYNQRSSLVITQAGNHFVADVNEMRDNLHPYAGVSSYGVQDMQSHHHLHQQQSQPHHNHHLHHHHQEMDDNNNTLHETVDEVIANTLKDDHCGHSPASQNGSQDGSPQHHGHTTMGEQHFLNLGSAQTTISENLNQLKYPRSDYARSESRPSPVSQESEFESDLQNFTQLTSVVVPNRINNNNLVIYSPTSQANSATSGGYDNTR